MSNVYIKPKVISNLKSIYDSHSKILATDQSLLTDVSPTPLLGLLLGYKSSDGDKQNVYVTDFFFCPSDSSIVSFAGHCLNQFGDVVSKIDYKLSPDAYDKLLPAEKNYINEYKNYISTVTPKNSSAENSSNLNLLILGTFLLSTDPVLSMTSEFIELIAEQSNCLGVRHSGSSMESAIALIFQPCRQNILHSFSLTREFINIYSEEDFSRLFENHDIEIHQILSPNTVSITPLSFDMYPLFVSQLTNARKQKKLYKKPLNEFDQKSTLFSESQINSIEGNGVIYDYILTLINILCQKKKSSLKHFKKVSSRSLNVTQSMFGIRNKIDRMDVEHKLEMNSLIRKSQIA